MRRTTSKRRLAVATVVLSLGVVLPAVAPAAPASAGHQQCPDFGSKSTTGRIRSDAVREASGLVASRSQPPILWTHNDSGGRNEVFAIGTGGAVKMTVRFGDIRVRDFEDISIGPGPGPGDYIYAADIGDNGNGRDSVWIYRFREPEVTSGTMTIADADVERFEFTYRRPSGGTWSRNAESLAVDPVTGDVVIIEKRHESRGGIRHTSWFYRIRQVDLVEGELLLAQPMVWAKTRYERDIGPPAAAEFSKDGRMLVVKNGYEVFAWLRRPGQSIYSAVKDDRATNCLYFGARGEAVAVGSGNGALFFVREGSDSPVERTPLSIPPPPVRCNGLDVTIGATHRDDVVIGTMGDDVINGLGGDDVIDGRGGDDVICGGNGNDTIGAGAGADIVYGGAGLDTIRGGAGADRLFGGPASDLLEGGDDDDRIWGGGSNDTLRGGKGFDRLDGGPGADDCRVGPGGGSTSAC